MKDEIISRSEVMKSITAEYNRKATGDGLKLAWIEKAVNSVKPKKGHWSHVGVEILGAADVYRCSECDRKSHGGNFCKHCGADMREEEE